MKGEEQELGDGKKTTNKEQFFFFSLVTGWNGFSPIKVTLLHMPTILEIK